MNKLIKRGLLAATAIAVPAGALLALPLAAHASPSLPGITVIRAWSTTPATRAP